MKALRRGSYSMLATRAGTSFLSKRKSTRRYFFLCPPPRCRIVMRPKAFLPPVFRFPRTSDFSGRCPERSFRYSTVANWRVLFVTGLYVFMLFTVPCSLLTDGDRVASLEIHVRFLASARHAVLPGARTAARFPADGDDAHHARPHAIRGGDCLRDAPLRRVESDVERIHALAHVRGRFLRDAGTPEDMGNVAPSMRGGGNGCGPCGRLGVGLLPRGRDAGNLLVFFESEECHTRVSL